MEAQKKTELSQLSQEKSDLLAREQEIFQEIEMLEKQVQKQVFLR